MAGFNESINPKDLRLEENVEYREQPLSLKLDEERVAEIIGKRIDNAKTFWDKELKLSEVRKDNEMRWKNENLEVNKVDLYKFQVPYRDNRIFLSVETLASFLAGKVPVPDVIEAMDTDASRELAENYSKVLYRRAEDLYLKGSIQMVARHLLMGYRIGVIKYYWDWEAGRIKEDGSFTGDVCARFIRPHRIVVDEQVENSIKVPLIAELISNTVEELGYKFPKKKDELMIATGHTPGDRTSMGDKIDYWETWFSYLDGEGTKREGLAWKYNNVILDFGDNPNWNTDPAKSNFFEQPQKPYVFFNFLNQGKWIYDDTSLTEQASSLQDVLEKRGRQIVENADDAKSTLIMNSMMIDSASAQKYVHNPTDIIMTKGDVRMAVNRIPPRELAKYVLEDKYDARNEIDNLFGTHAPIRGQETASPTLGQEVMSQRSDLGRMNYLSEQLEKGATEVYRGMTQLYKVFGTEETMVKYIGEDSGKATFIAFSGDKIEDGVEIRVRAGSIKLDDKMTDRNEAVELAKIGGRIDPYTFAEKWHVDKPREFATRLFYFLFDPQKYASEVLKIAEGGGDKEAMQTIQMINSGQDVPGKQNPSKEYVAYYGQFVKSPNFKQLDPEIQQLHIKHLKETIAMGKQGLKVSPQGQPPEAGQPPVQGQPAPAPQGGGIMEKMRGMFGGQ